MVKQRCRLAGLDPAAYSAQTEVSHFSDFGCGASMKPEGYLVPKWVNALAFLFVIVSFIASLCIFVAAETNGWMNAWSIVALIVLNVSSTSVSVLLLLFVVKHDAMHLSRW